MGGCHYFVGRVANLSGHRHGVSVEKWKRTRLSAVSKAQSLLHGHCAYADGAAEGGALGRAVPQ